MEKKIPFTNVFDTKADQLDVYEKLGPQLIKDLFEGKNGLIFAYGLTNSGKTYTIEGTESQKGVLPRLLKDIVKKLRSQDSSFSKRAKMVVSYVEIYQEKILDLLEEDPLKKKKSLKLIVYKNETYISGVKNVHVCCPKDALEIYKRGSTNRHFSSTQFNKRSSRSHSLFTIKLIDSNADIKSQNLNCISSICVADLAGAEKTAKVDDGKESSAANVLFGESTKINNSLLVLGRVLKSLMWNQKNKEKNQRAIPWREAVITRVLKNYFLSAGRCFMIVNAWVTPETLNQTLRVLDYASAAISIKTVSKINNSLSYAKLKGFKPYKDLPLETADLLSNFLSLKQILLRLEKLIPIAVHCIILKQKQKRELLIRKTLINCRNRIRKERKEIWEFVVKSLFKYKVKYKSYKNEKIKKIKKLKQKYSKRIKAEKFKNESYKNLIIDLQSKIITQKEIQKSNERKFPRILNAIRTEKDRNKNKQFKDSNRQKQPENEFSLIKAENTKNKNIKRINKNIIKKPKNNNEKRKKPSLRCNLVKKQKKNILKREENCVKSVVKENKSGLGMIEEQSVTKEALFSLTVNSLKEILRDYNLKVSGIKTDLVDRVHFALKIADCGVKIEHIKEKIEAKKHKPKRKIKPKS